MPASESLHPALISRLVDGLYVEAMVMADEARSYFDSNGVQGETGADTVTRLSFTCESLKVTTRLMHVIAWLLTQRAWQRGEISNEALCDPKYRLGAASQTDAGVAAAMPEGARQLVEGSQSLYDRVLRLQNQLIEARSSQTSQARGTMGMASPARDLLGRLEKAF